MTQQPCVYCGAVGANEKKPDPRNAWGKSFYYNGVDRTDNSVGYTHDNSVSCCGTCNYMKWRNDAEVFIEQCRRIVEHVDSTGSGRHL